MSLEPSLDLRRQQDVQCFPNARLRQYSANVGGGRGKSGLALVKRKFLLFQSLFSSFPHVP